MDIITGNSFDTLSIRHVFSEIVPYKDQLLLAEE